MKDNISYNEITYFRRRLALRIRETIGKFPGGGSICDAREIKTCIPLLSPARCSHRSARLCLVRLLWLFLPVTNRHGEISARDVHIVLINCKIIASQGILHEIFKMEYAQESIKSLPTLVAGCYQTIM
jgi:hypothetical protein